MLQNIFSRSSFFLLIFITDFKEHLNFVMCSFTYLFMLLWKNGGSFIYLYITDFLLMIISVITLVQYFKSVLLNSDWFLSWFDWYSEASHIERMVPLYRVLRIYRSMIAQIRSELYGFVMH